MTCIFAQTFCKRHKSLRLMVRNNTIRNRTAAVIVPWGFHYNNSCSYRAVGIYLPAQKLNACSIYVP